jgi:hypothetical protein
MTRSKKIKTCLQFSFDPLDHSLCSLHDFFADFGAMRNIMIRQSRATVLNEATECALVDKLKCLENVLE